MPGPNRKKRRKKRTMASESHTASLSEHKSSDLGQLASNDSNPQGENDSDVSYIERRWNGPRVLNIPAFVTSRHAVAPSMEDSICAIYAVPEVRDMMLKVLPQETALVLWYNKSRKSARICPACRRFYAVGDILLPHLIDDQNGSRAEYVDPRNLREKRISGLCSLMCFGIASYNWPGAIGAWGKCASEIDARTQMVLQGPGANIADDGMGAFMKLSRMENLLDVIHDMFRAGSTLY